jgi:MerR family mercuric resistance operon transcriptional regulator
MATIGIAAKRAGCSVETIRYYERIGLVSAPPRARNGRRSYGEDEVRQIKFIRRCRNLGFSLKEVATLVSLSTTGGEACARVKSIAAAQVRSVREKMADLARVEEWLAQMIAQCDAPRHEGCPMIDTLFAAETQITA